MKTLDTALQLLRLFETEDLTRSVTEVAEALGLPKSKVSRLLAVFRDHGFLEQDSQTRRYRVGLSAFELGANYVKSQPLVHEALPVLRAVVDSTGHSATLSVMRGDRILHILAVEGPHYVDSRWRVGNRLPFHATSAGKILIAGLSAAELESFLRDRELPAITALTVTDPAELRAQLEKIRQCGASVTHGESAPGLAAVAVPVFDRTNKIAAALGLIIPDQLFVSDETESLIALLHREARRLSIKLGAGGYPFGVADWRPAPARRRVSA